MEYAAPALKQYRSPRRRPAHLRTKTGCLPCRKRKRKCDELKPVCHNCSVSKSSNCTWPPNRITHVKASAGSPTSIKPTEDEKDGSQGEVVPQKSSSALSIQTAESTPLWILKGVPLGLGLPLSGRGNHVDVTLFDFMRHVFIPQLIRPATYQPNLQLLTRENIQLGLRRPCYLSALLACSGAEMRENEGIYRPLAEAYYSAAVTDLRSFLVRDFSDDDDVTALRTTMLLLVYERTRTCFSPHLETHLQGAAALLRALMLNDETRGSSMNSLTVQKDIKTSLLESFVFHAATSIPFQAGIRQSRTIDEAFALAQRSLEAQPLDESCLQRSSPVLGAPPELFRHVRQVGLLYQSSQNGAIDLYECYQLERELMRWDDGNTQDICASVSTQADHSQNNHESWFDGPDHDDVLLLGPRIYQLASRILIRELINTRIGNTECSTKDLTSEALALVDRLQPSVDYFADYYAWPFFAIGVYTTDDAARQCLMNKTLAFWEVTKNGTMHRLKELLTEIWGWQR